MADRTFVQRRQAELWERQQLSRLDTSGWVDPALGRSTLAAVAEEWLPLREPQVERRTFQSDQSALRVHILPALGARPLAALRRTDVEDFARSLVSDKHLSAATATRVLATLKGLLAYATRDGRVLINVASNVIVRRSTRSRGDAEGAPTTARPLTLEELSALYRSQRERSNQADITLVLGLTGLRWGELAGLQVGDVSLGSSITGEPTMTLDVTRVVIYDGGGGPASLKPYPKGRRRRAVPVAAAAVPLVQARMDGRGCHEPLFASPGGGLLHESNWRRAVGWTSKTGHRPHDLRHTAASLFIAAGADLKSVQALLGHQSSRTTHDIYGHLLSADHLSSAVHRLDTLIGDELILPAAVMQDQERSGK
ncbi:MAG TPA: tyrosine-type recombinase/integrase [Actinomycetes bacterium]|nr:tyrosine-type recombinase/integrase [Actinomycetes bacterium]